MVWIQDAQNDRTRRSVTILVVATTGTAVPFCWVLFVFAFACRVCARTQVARRFVINAALANMPNAPALVTNGHSSSWLFWFECLDVAHCIQHWELTNVHERVQVVCCFQFNAHGAHKALVAPNELFQCNDVDVVLLCKCTHFQVQSLVADAFWHVFHNCVKRIRGCPIHVALITKLGALERVPLNDLLHVLCLVFCFFTNAHFVITMSCHSVLRDHFVLCCVRQYALQRIIKQISA